MRIKVRSPSNGWAGPVEEAPDPVFAGGLLGAGVAVDPTDGVLRAPFAGVVVSLAPTRHAVALRSDAGLEVLLHVGVDTVALQGEGFDVETAVGRRVELGAPLIRFDLDRLAERATSLLIVVVATNVEAFACVWRHGEGLVQAGDVLMELEPQTDAGRPSPLPGASAPVAGGHVAWVHGVHARPAARLARLASAYSAQIGIVGRGRRADAKSALDLMTLGLVQGDGFEVHAVGPDASAAANALVEALMTPEAPDAPAGEGAKAEASDDAETTGPGASVAEGVYRGTPAAPGLVFGPVYSLRRRLRPSSAAGLETAGLSRPVDPDQEAGRLARGLERAAARLAAEIETGGVGREVLIAHLAMMTDPQLREAAAAEVARGSDAQTAWLLAVDRRIAALEAVEDVRIRARAVDLQDVGRRGLVALTGDRPGDGGGLGSHDEGPPAGAILLADEILPSELLALQGRAAGVCTAGGGPTSHAAIIAAGLGLPFLVGAGDAVLATRAGTWALLDGSRGQIWMDPPADAVAAAQAEMAQLQALRRAQQARARRPAQTLDGREVAVLANLGAVAEAAGAVAAGADGCGLLRTEFLFLDRDEPPDEDEQRRAYQAVADALDGRPLVIRTLDLGGDKPARFLRPPAEANPALGLRGLRLSLWRPDLLRAQLRAALRVRGPGEVRIMAPMVSQLSELLALRRMLVEAAGELGVAPPPLGVMVETPAAALTAEVLAKAADFFSIGTNDLTQYALAMDRENGALAGDIDGLHPAVARLIALTCEGARALRRPVGVCGAIASDPLAAPLLIGLGVCSLSVVPARIGEIKATVSAVSLDACEALAARARRAETADAVRRLLSEFQGASTPSGEEP